MCYVLLFKIYQLNTGTIFSVRKDCGVCGV